MKSSPLFRIETKGKCFACHNTFSRSEYLVHINECASIQAYLSRQTHNSADTETGDVGNTGGAFFLIEDLHRPEMFWIYIGIPSGSRLALLDQVLRNHWMSCCNSNIILDAKNQLVDGHISYFQIRDKDLKSVKEIYCNSISLNKSKEKTILMSDYTINQLLTEDVEGLTSGEGTLYVFDSGSSQSVLRIIYLPQVTTPWSLGKDHITLFAQNILSSYTELRSSSDTETRHLIYCSSCHGNVETNTETSSKLPGYAAVETICGVCQKPYCNSCISNRTSNRKKKMMKAAQDNSKGEEGMEEDFLEVIECPVCKSNGILLSIVNNPRLGLIGHGYELNQENSP